MTREFVETYRSDSHPSVLVEDLDGVSWAQTRRPFPIHGCRVQTNGWHGFTQIWRCRCGALCRPRPGGRWAQHWSGRNSRWRHLRRRTR